MLYALPLCTLVQLGGRAEFIFQVFDVAPTVSSYIEGQGQYSTLGIYLLINSQRAVLLARVNGLDDQEPVSQLLHSAVRGVGL